MDNKLIVLTTLIVAALVVASPFIFPQSENSDIVGMYDIYEYHQYSMEEGKLVVNQSGDGAYDTEFIEITSCADGIISGYCCVPMPGEKNPKHYPILGTFDKETGYLQYTCSYDYPSSGLYDWVQGYIKDGLMQLSGITFGNDGSYYGSFQFTFVKHGHSGHHVTFGPIFKTNDKYESFKVLTSIDDKEIADPGLSVSFEVKMASDGLYHMSVTNPISEPAQFVGSEIIDDLIMGIGYDENGKPFSLLISKQGDYVQVNREYLMNDRQATWTAYLTEDGKEVPVKTLPAFKDLSFRGTSVIKTTPDVVKKNDIKMTLTTLSNSLTKVTINDSNVSYGNPIPSGNGYLIAISESHSDSSLMIYHWGFLFLDKNMKDLAYSGLYMSANGELNAIYCKEVAI